MKRPPTVQEVERIVSDRKATCDRLRDAEASTREQMEAQANLAHALDLLHRVRSGGYVSEFEYVSAP